MRRGRLTAEDLVNAGRQQVADCVTGAIRLHGLGPRDAARLAWMVCWFVTGNVYDNRRAYQPLPDEAFERVSRKLSRDGRAAARAVFERGEQGWTIVWPRIDGVRRPDIPAAVRQAVFSRDQHRCVRCGATDFLHLDHIRPWSAGGEHTVENLQVLCRDCNLAKGATLSPAGGVA